MSKEAAICNSCAVVFDDGVVCLMQVIIAHENHFSKFWTQSMGPFENKTLLSVRMGIFQNLKHSQWDILKQNPSVCWDGNISKFGTQSVGHFENKTLQSVGTGIFQSLIEGVGKDFLRKIKKQIINGKAIGQF